MSPSPKYSLRSATRRNTLRTGQSSPANRPEITEITGMLVSWLDCIALDILHEQYPQPISHSRPHVSQLTKNHHKAPVTSSVCDFLRGVYTPNDPSEEQCASIKSTITNHFTDVFDQSETLRCMEGPEKIIQLKADDAIPYYVNGARLIAFADRAEVK